MDSKNANQIENKNNKINYKNSKIETIESQLSLEKTKVQNLEAKLLNKDNELRNTKNRLISLEENFVDVKRELSFTKKELSNVTSSFDNKINVLEDDFADVKQELIETKKQLSQVTNQVSQVTRQVSQVNNQVSQVSRQLSNINKQLAEETENSHYFKEYLLNRSLENEYIRNNDKITKKIISPLSYVYLLAKSKFSEIGINIKLYRALKGSNSFDIGYYFNKYPDIPNSKWCKYFSPQLHYVCRGFAEKRTFSDKNYSYNNKSELLKEIRRK